LHLSWTSGRWNKCRWTWQWPSATWILGSPSPPQVSFKLFLPSPKFTGRRSSTQRHKSFTPSLSTPSTVALHVSRSPGKPQEKFDRPIPRNASRWFTLSPGKGMPVQLYALPPVTQNPSTSAGDTCRDVVDLRTHQQTPHIYIYQEEKKIYTYIYIYTGIAPQSIREIAGRNFRSSRRSSPNPTLTLLDFRWATVCACLRPSKIDRRSLQI
jgi:hypothetical protein